MSGDTEARYRPALELYRTTRLSIREICERTATPVAGFRSYIQRHCRELMFERHGVDATDAQTRLLKKQKGQTAAAHARYRDAILACDNAAYIEYNISQIAHLFHLNPTGLGNQLRNHFPEILQRREKERQRRGLISRPGGAPSPVSNAQYADAVDHLRSSDDTVRHTAALYGLSLSGLRQHLLFYHKELLNRRSDKRTCAKGGKLTGALTGNGQRHLPADAQTEKYTEAVRLYSTTAMTQKQVAAATGLPLNGLRNYLRTWHPELILDHRCARPAPGSPLPQLSSTKPYQKSTAVKYADAIGRLRTSGLSTAEVAHEFGLNAEAFRLYLHEHEPALAASLGMTVAPNGRRVLVRSAQKYAEAVRLFETTAEPLKSIADRLSLNYKSLFGFIRRNHPDAIARRNLH